MLWFGAVAGSAVLIIYFYRRATRPAAELAAIAKDIAEGNVVWKPKGVNGEWAKLMAAMSAHRQSA